MDCRLLLIEDDDDTRVLLKETLEKEGGKVVAVRSGEDGVYEFGRQKFDCLIVDYGLPGMNGIEFVAKIRKMDPKVGVVMTTGGPKERVEDLCDGLSIWSVVGKPVSLPCLLEKVETACELARMPKEKEEKLIHRWNEESTRIHSLSQDLLDETNYDLPKVEPPAVEQ